MFQPTLAFMKDMLDGAVDAVGAPGPLAGCSMRLYTVGSVLTVGSLAAAAVAPVYDGYADQAIPAFAQPAFLSAGKPRVQSTGLTFRPTGATTSAVVAGYAIVLGAALIGWEPFATPKSMGTVDDVIVIDAGLAMDPLANWGSNPVEL